MALNIWLIKASRDQKAGHFFTERKSITNQRGNAASLLDTLPVDSIVEDTRFIDSDSGSISSKYEQIKNMY